MSRKRRESGAGRAALERSAPIFAALGDPRRLWILARLSAEGPLSISRLTSGAHVTRQAVTKHLEVLSSAGLVRDERLGRERRFELEPEPLSEARRHLETISAGWDRATARLRREVEA
jgi:DNA-binding transcriptional ArsR family regulator